MCHLSIVSLLDANIWCGPVRGVPLLLGPGRRRALLLGAGEEVRRRCLGPGRRCAATSSGSGRARRLGGQERGRAATTVPFQVCVCCWRKKLLDMELSCTA